jgi:hypothetical protein
VLFFCFSFYCGGFTLIAYNCIGGVMVSMLADDFFARKKNKKTISPMYQWDEEE